MARSRRSAKSAGSAMEMSVRDTLIDATGDTRISRSGSKGQFDTGDIENLYHNGKPVVVECKNESTLKLSGWWTEVIRECQTMGTELGVVAHKRKRVQWPSSGPKVSYEQWVTAPLSMWLLWGKDFSDAPEIKGPEIMDKIALAIKQENIHYAKHTRVKYSDDPWVTTTMGFFAREILQHMDHSEEAEVLIRSNGSGRIRTEKGLIEINKINIVKE